MDSLQKIQSTYEYHIWGKIMNVWNNLQNISFKKMTIIFVIMAGITFLGIYTTCGTLYKVDCHEVILSKFPRGF